MVVLFFIGIDKVIIQILGVVSGSYSNNHATWVKDGLHLTIPFFHKLSTCGIVIVGFHKVVKDNKVCVGTSGCGGKTCCSYCTVPDSLFCTDR